MSLVNGKVVRWLVGGGNSGRVSKDSASVAMGTFVLEKVSDVFIREFAVETLLHVLHFRGNHRVVVVGSGLIDESLVEHGLEQQVEVRHESSVVSVLVLAEDGLQSVVHLLVDWIRLGLR